MLSTPLRLAKLLLVFIIPALVYAGLTVVVAIAAVRLGTAAGARLFAPSLETHGASTMFGNYFCRAIVCGIPAVAMLAFLGLTQWWNFAGVGFALGLLETVILVQASMTMSREWLQDYGVLEKVLAIFRSMPHALPATVASVVAWLLWAAAGSASAGRRRSLFGGSSH